MAKLKKTYLLVVAPNTIMVPHREGGGEVVLSDSEIEEIFGTPEVPRLDEQHLVVAPSNDVPTLATLGRVVGRAGNKVYLEGECLVTVTKHIRRRNTLWAGVIRFEAPSGILTPREVIALRVDFIRFVRSNPHALKTVTLEETLKRIQAADTDENLVGWLLALTPLPVAERRLLVPLSAADQVRGLRAWLTSPNRKGETNRLRPLTAEDRGFLQAILESPEDDFPRLVYADWLDDRDDRRGEFIRVQCELAKIKYHGRRNKRQEKLLEREQELLEEYGEEWKGTLVRSGKYIIFNRGFPIPERLSVDEFVREGQRVFDLCPVQHLTLINTFGARPKNALLKELASSPLLGRLKGLSCTIDGLIDRRSDYDATGLGIGDEGVRILAASQHLSQLTHLNLRENEIGDEGARALALSRSLGSLVELDLSANPVGIEGGRALAASKTLGNLTKLNLAGTQIGVEGARLLRARFGTCRR